MAGPSGRSDRGNKNCHQPSGAPSGGGERAGGNRAPPQPPPETLVHGEAPSCAQPAAERDKEVVWGQRGGG